MTRLVSVVLTLAVPDEADPEDAAALAADAATDLALDVVAAAAVEGHLPLPGALVQRQSGNGRPWRVETLTPAGAVLADLAGTRIHAPLTALGPDRYAPVPVR